MYAWPIAVECFAHSATVKNDKVNEYAIGHYCYKKAKSDYFDSTNIIIVCNSLSEYHIKYKIRNKYDNTLEESP